MGNARIPYGDGSNRLSWPELPMSVQAEVERIAGGAVVDAVTQGGGAGTGVAARLRLDNGGRVFAKATNRTRDPSGLYRQEVPVATAMPDYAPAPRLLGHHDDGEWVALVFTDIDGHQPHRPWQSDELTRVLDAMTGLAGTLTPSPVSLPSASESPRLGRWSTIAASSEHRTRLAAFAPEAAANLDLRCRVEADWPAAAAGQTLVHGDIQSHNILLTPDDVVFVDWPFARVGAACLDLLIMLCEATMLGTDVEPIVERHPVTTDVPTVALDALLAAHAGYLIASSIAPCPPSLHAFHIAKRALGRATLTWLSRRLSLR